MKNFRGKYILDGKSKVGMSGVGGGVIIGETFY